MEILGQSGTVGIFGIFAILLVREALLFAGKHPIQNGDSKAVHTVPAQCPIVTRMESKVEEVHRLHTIRDADGVTVLPRLAQQSRLQTELLVEIRDGIAVLVNGSAGTPTKRAGSK